MKVPLICFSPFSVEWNFVKRDEKNSPQYCVDFHIEKLYVLHIFFINNYSFSCELSLKIFNLMKPKYLKKIDNNYLYFF